MWSRVRRAGWSGADQVVEARYAELSDAVEQIAYRVGHSK
jgi:hypothetical protein